MLFSGDGGKDSLKAKVSSGLFTFPTRYTIGERVIPTVESNTYNIELNGELYKVGEFGRIDSYNASKNEKIHRLALFVAMAKAIPVNEPIRLVTGTPVNLFFTDERERIKDSLMGEHLIGFGEDLDTRILNIERVLVVPESMGCIYNNYGEYGKGLIKVIDLGGLNINGCIYEDGKPVRSSVFTVNDGIKILMNSIRNTLNSGGHDYQPYEVRHLVMNGKGTAIEEAVISNTIRAYLQELHRLVGANNWNIDSGIVVFTGGGSKLLARFITEEFRNARISKDGVYDNVKGFYTIGEALLCQ